MDNPEVPKLSDRIGETVLALIPRIHHTIYQKIKLVGVEDGGLWIQSQQIMTDLLRAAGVATSPRTLVIFLPFHEISAILCATDEVGLDEKAFGL
ncbi:MAG: hypothetical protein M3Y27_31175 [Acidobacteriota bacterium]|nr:hypothetical protein [Acidobacteriota bacterium]